MNTSNKSEQVTVRLGTRLFKELQARAALERRPLAQLARIAIEEYLRAAAAPRQGAA